MKSLKYLLVERSGGISKGCAMLYFNLPEMEKIHSMIDKEDLYDEPGFGLETEPHCTLLYGFHDEDCDAKDVLNDISKMKMPAEIKLVNASLFENDYDVLKFDVKSPENELHEVNQMLTGKYPYTNDFPDYHPHCTIAYIKKGEGKKYVEKFKDLELTVNPHKVVYSDKDRNKTEIKL